MKHQINLKINRKEVRAEVESRTLLVHFIRDQQKLTGTHIGCDTSSCGACTILLDGKAVKSCTLLAVQSDGSEITTVEGLSDNGSLHPIQQSFNDHHGLQCGFCTPGIIMLALDFLKTNPNPSNGEIREALEGNYCRCTGYQNIVKSIKYAAEKMKFEAEAEVETEGKGKAETNVEVEAEVEVVEIPAGKGTGGVR